MKIITASIKNIEDLIPLFDAYRQFYRQKTDFKEARKFLSSRLQNNDSIIYLAYDKDIAIGFVQLYPLFSSVTMEPMLLLNDLYISESYRCKGVGESLIEQAKDYCRKNFQNGLAIQTEANNRAQYLYERLGFEKDPDIHLFWKCH